MSSEIVQMTVNRPSQALQVMSEIVQNTTSNQTNAASNHNQKKLQMTTLHILQTMLCILLPAFPDAFPSAFPDAFQNTYQSSCRPPFTVAIFTRNTVSEPRAQVLRLSYSLTEG